MKVPGVIYRLMPVVMMAIDIVTPIVIMGLVGSWLNKFELGLAVGFALGLFAFFRHWSTKTTTPKDFRHLFQRNEQPDSKGEGQ